MGGGIGGKEQERGMVLTNGYCCSRRVSSMLRSALDDGLTSQTSVLKFIGERFRVKVDLPPWTSDEDVARHLLRYTTLSVLFCVRV